jgi:hypothetical protein
MTYLSCLSFSGGKSCTKSWQHWPNSMVWPNIMIEKALSFPPPPSEYSPTDGNCIADGKERGGIHIRSWWPDRKPEPHGPFSQSIEQQATTWGGAVFICINKQLIIRLKGQSHEKVGEMSVWGISLGPN